MTSMSNKALSHKNRPFKSLFENNETLTRNNTDNVSKHAIYQTIYSQYSFSSADFTIDKSGILHGVHGAAAEPIQPQDIAAHEVNWLHFVGINNSNLLRECLASYSVHELVLEDILSSKQRPKIEDYGKYIFIAARVYQYTKNGLISDQVYLIVGENYLLTFQQRPLGLFSAIRQRLRNGSFEIQQHDAAFLAYLFIDRLVDDYFLTLERFNNHVEKIDKNLFEETLNNNDLLNQIHRLKHDAMRLKRTVEPLRDVLAQLVQGNFKLFNEETHIYLRDTYDHIKQLIESIESAHYMVMGMLDIHLSFQSNHLNQQMRVLTVVTLFFMPLTLITGIYGMNFDNMPELHYQHGYYYVLSVMVVIIICLLIYFHRRKWL